MRCSSSSAPLPPLPVIPLTSLQSRRKRKSEGRKGVRREVQGRRRGEGGRRERDGFAAGSDEGDRQRVTFAEKRIISLETERVRFKEGDGVHVQTFSFL